jgi:transglutaminase-like putative cysteine protease
MTTGAMTTALDRSKQLRLIAVLLFVLAPHAPHVAPWCVGAIGALALWRVAAILRRWPALPQLLRAALALGAFAAVHVTYGRITGQTAGLALLMLMAGLKLTELRTRRDVVFLLLLLYFILITHFLFSQDPWTIVYMLVAAVLVTAVMIDINHEGAPLPLRTALRTSGVLIAQSLPLMLVMFVLFPRIPGPLWGIPADEGAARSGLTDTMAPGDIERLIESDATAFRVRFFGPPPPMDLRYWRGPVLDMFDGRRWTSAPQRVAGSFEPARLDDALTRYEVILEPTNQSWLFALDLVDPGSLPADARLTSGYMIRTRDPIIERRLYTVSSHLRYTLSPRLGAGERSRDLRLPPFGNPRTHELAQQWRAGSADDAAVVQRALAYFHNENFVYTLQPPRLGPNPVDQFLFETRRGFCEHYASSFTVLMRAAGIPARVVTGYQGGEKNAVGDYYIVRQSDAHAWSEVWLRGRGWVRVDPTAAVAPERIEAGIGRALRGSEDLPAFLNPAQRRSSRFAIAARWDWVNEQWSRWVLAYGPELQHDVLSRIGLDGWEDLMLALTVVLSLLLGAAGVLVMRGSRPPPVTDAALRAWHKLQRRLARKGLVQRADEGPRDFVRRAAADRPDIAQPLGRVLELYLRARYLEAPDAALQRALDAAVSALH